jgi:glycosyltransferase involved in cell wall biosynthesis
LYVPHGVDTQAFEPLDDEGRSEARTAFGVDDEDRFIVGVVAANQGYPSRKALPELIDAFGRFLRTEEGKGALLYLHTERTGRYQGVNLEPIIAAARIPRENVRFAAQYEYLTGGFGADYMARAYNAMDVLLNPAMGEGFGVPIIEAQACGTPVIVGENTAQVEIGKVGWHVGGQRIWTAQDSWQTVPDVEQMVGALRMARSMSYRKRGAAREHALQYDVDHVTRTYWRPALERLAEMVEQSRMARSFLIPSAPVSS